MRRAVALALAAMLAAGCSWSGFSDQERQTAQATTTGRALVAWGYRAVGHYDAKMDDLVSGEYWIFQLSGGCGSKSPELCNAIAESVRVAVAPPHGVMAVRGHKIECRMPAAGANFGALSHGRQELFLRGPNTLYHDQVTAAKHQMVSPYHFGPDVGPGGVAWDCVHRSN